jgi:hypothetical protein
MRVALSTLWTRVRHDLPVMCDGLAGCQIADHGCDECDCEKDMEVAEEALVRALPGRAREGAEEYADAVFDCPKTVFHQCSIRLCNEG